MKKLFVVLFLVIVLVGIGVSKKVEAVTFNFDPAHVSPRFQYLYDETDTLIPFEYTIWENYDYGVNSEVLDIQLNQVTYDGVFIKTLERFETDFEIYNSTITNVNASFVATATIAYVEYVYVGDLEYIYDEFYNFTVLINGSPISDDLWNLAFEGTYILLDPAVSIIGDNITVAYAKENSNTYFSDLNYDWSGLLFEDEEIVFYNVVYSDWILGTGAVMKSPAASIFEDYGGSDHGLEFGTFLSRDSGLADVSFQEDFTSYLDTDNYWIIHYRIPEAYINSSLYSTIQITDINSNTIEDTLTTDDFLQIQQGNDYDRANSFMVIPINGVLGDGLVATYNDGYNYDYYLILHDYEVGSYFIGMVDQYTGNTYMTSASVVWNVVETVNPFELSIMKEELAIDELQRVIFYKNDELISSSYTTTVAEDVALSESHVDIVNSTNYNFAISYYLDELLVSGDCSSVRWYLEPSFIPYSLDPAVYQIELEEDYCTIDEIDIGGHIDNLLVYYAFDTEIGGWTFSILVLLFINIFMIFFTKAVFIYSFVNMVVILLLSFLGLVPMWLIIGVFILGFMGVKSVISGGVNYE